MDISAISDTPAAIDPLVQQHTIHPSPHEQIAPLPGTGAVDTADVVQLSQGAQVQQLAMQGVGTSAIASSTGLTVTEVDTDLGITPASTSVPVAISVGHSGGHHEVPASAAAPHPAIP